jgi:hypothetical protein
MSTIRDIVGAFRQVFNRNPKHSDLPGMSYKQGEALKMVSFNKQAFICVDHKEDYEEFIATLKNMPENACFLPDDFGSSTNDDLLASLAQRCLMKTAKGGYEDLRKALLNFPVAPKGMEGLPPEKVVNLLKLEAAISESNPHDRSIMKYGSLCSCDDRFLCEHRQSWIINFVKENFCQ